jgi:hypothetical protein
MRAAPRVFALIIVFVLASWSASGLAQPAQPEPPQLPLSGRLHLSLHPPRLEASATHASEGQLARP